jgi:hypothetical protein
MDQNPIQRWGVKFTLTDYHQPVNFWFAEKESNLSCEAGNGNVSSGQAHAITAIPKYKTLKGCLYPKKITEGRIFLHLLWDCSRNSNVLNECGPPQCQPLNKKQLEAPF